MLYPDSTSTCIDTIGHCKKAEPKKSLLVGTLLCRAVMLGVFRILDLRTSLVYNSSIVVFRIELV